MLSSTFIPVTQHSDIPRCYLTSRLKLCLLNTPFRKQTKEQERTAGVIFDVLHGCGAWFLSLREGV
jgi:hypothetical protein